MSDDYAPETLVAHAQAVTIDIGASPEPTCPLCQAATEAGLFDEVEEA